MLKTKARDSMLRAVPKAVVCGTPRARIRAVLEDPKSREQVLAELSIMIAEREAALRVLHGQLRTLLMKRIETLEARVQELEQEGKS